MRLRLAASRSLALAAAAASLLGLGVAAASAGAEEPPGRVLSPPPIVAADAPPSPEPPAGETPSRKPAKPSMTMKQLEEKIRKYPAAFGSMLVLKWGVAIAGLIVGILAWIRRRDQRHGFLPPPAPSSPPPAPFRVAAAFLLVIVGVLGGSYVVVLGSRLGWISAEEGSAPLMQSFLAVAACTVPASLVAYAAIRWKRRDSAAAPWGARESSRLGLTTYLVASAAVAALTLVSAIVVSAFGKEPEPQEVIVRLLDPKARADLLFVAFFGIVVAPITEECLFRGVLFTSLRDAVGLRGAAVIQAVAFSAVHTDVTAALPLFALALFLAWVYQRTGSLLAPILVHALNNATSLVPLLLTLA